MCKRALDLLRNWVMCGKMDPLADHTTPRILIVLDSGMLPPDHVMMRGCSGLLFEKIRNCDLFGEIDILASLAESESAFMIELAAERSFSSPFGLLPGGVIHMTVISSA